MTQSVKAAVLQYPVNASIRQNLDNLLPALDSMDEETLVVTPEGGLSGYEPNPVDLLQTLDAEEILKGLAVLQEVVKKRRLHLFLGSYLQEKGDWFNTTFYFGPRGERHLYKKVNLAFHEQRYLKAGDTLPVFPITIAGAEVRVAVQMCRELRHPEQWLYLARQGAKIFAFLNNAIGDSELCPIWRSHVISRAAETQRYVIAPNAAGEGQKCPTMIVSPKGRVLVEHVSLTKYVGHASLDLTEVSDWGLNQSRSDIVRVVGRDEAWTQRSTPQPQK